MKVGAIVFCNVGTLRTSDDFCGLDVITFTPWTTTTPPIGWHPASADCLDGWLRYWNGAMWSAPVHESAADADLDRLRSVTDQAAPAVVWWRSYSPEFLSWLDAEAARPPLSCAA